MPIISGLHTCYKQQLTPSHHNSILVQQITLQEKDVTLKNKLEGHSAECIHLQRSQVSQYDNLKKGQTLYLLPLIFLWEHITHICSLSILMVTFQVNLG